MLDNRVKEIRSAFGLTQKELADIMATTPMTVSNLETGKMKLSHKIEQKIEGYFNLPRHALRRSNYLSVPLIGSAAAGKPTFSEENFDGYVSMPNMHDYNFGEVIAVKVTGDSMNERIRDGDIAYVHLQDTISHGTVGAFAYQGGLIIKQFHQIDGHIELISFNPDYSPIIINSSDADFRILGKVIGTFSRI